MKFSNARQVKEAFEEVYNEIYKTRFWGLPITNHFLSVQVVGLRETEDFYTFCLITPWMLNKVVVPRKDKVDVQRLKGMRQDCIDRLGKFWVINVLSPMDQFKSMQEAVAQAEMYAGRLFSDISRSDDGDDDGMSRRDFFQKIIPGN